MDVNRTATIAFTIHGPIEREDLPGLSARVCALLTASGAALAICECQGIAADAVSADALARLQLAARRRGCRVLLRGSSRELRELIAWMGLEEVLPEAPP